MSAFICDIWLCLCWIASQLQWLWVDFITVPPTYTPTADLCFVWLIMTKLHILCWQNLPSSLEACYTQGIRVSQLKNVSFSKYIMINFHQNKVIWADKLLSFAKVLLIIYIRPAYATEKPHPIRRKEECRDIIKFFKHKLHCLQ